MIKKLVKTKSKTSESQQRKENFYTKVYQLTRSIPKGKVSTYGTIAELAGSRVSARMVGYAMHTAANSDVPCHRVVNRNGELTGKHHFGHPDLMRDLLLAEGIQFKGESVDMQKHFYDFAKPSKSKKRKSD